MKQAFYKVERYEDKWAVVVCSDKILVCKTKKTAVELAKRAACMIRDIGLPTPEQDLSRHHDLGEAHLTDSRNAPLTNCALPSID
jgi:hypothetical protein